MDKSKLVITIERQYGSGGRIVGKKLAEELNIPFYDDEILSMTAEKAPSASAISVLQMKRRKQPASQDRWKSAFSGRDFR